ncbi:MAG: PQQ-dependent dehydrogenase, methanol/ethanol family [Woeseiaceae bacterium]|nr:PQQ-dependent dehydrogenase, methanol/ethanol family [Woeseiaceae bacterium]
MSYSRLYGLAAIVLCVAACDSREEPPAPVASGAAVSHEDIVAAAPDDWLTHGRDYAEQRYSPLDAINADNVAELGLAWYFDVPTERGMEATPIVVDGRMYVTGSWSIVYALDAATGDELWRHDPEVPKSWAQYACCDAVNRGVAAWGDSIFVGTLDGYLVSLDMATGTVNWKVDTIDRKPPYTITGAPRVIDGKVIIGNGGADLGVRGYVSAYDADSGELAWRFHTVPGNPDDGFENDALALAADTWTGTWWQHGGGGTVWDSMAYDPALDLLYIGVGNGSPWNQRLRSPGGGDNLFLSSIVALRPATGEYVWHYQTTPGDTWDFTATQHIVLADLEIGGEARKVLMQAPKNGFFYVLDRADGSLISAEPYVAVTWASGIDTATGRPVEAPGARYESGMFLNMPSGLGGHNWHPMSFSPETGLVYLPSQDLPAPYLEDAGFEFAEGFWNTGIDFRTLETPADPAMAAEVAKMVRGQLVAWDPVEQREVWRYQHLGPWNGGTLATAGGLVFQGSLVGEFAAYDAGSGERLWVTNAQTGVAAAPATYAVDGEQYVAVAAGWGTIFALLGGEGLASLGLQNKSRILAFKRGGTAALPELPPAEPRPVPQPPERTASAETIERGKLLYYQRCAACHGVDVASGGITPDLRYTSAEIHDAWDAIVLGGALRGQGMPAFDSIFDAEDSDAVQAFVIEAAHRAYARQQ